jgi:hypothetical protein
LFTTSYPQVCQPHVHMDAWHQHMTIMLVPAALQKERWDGAWVGQQAAQQVFKADEAYSILEVRFLQACSGGRACLALLSLHLPRLHQYCSRSRCYQRPAAFAMLLVWNMGSTDCIVLFCYAAAGACAATVGDSQRSAV